MTDPGPLQVQFEVSSVDCIPVVRVGKRPKRRSTRPDSTVGQRLHFPVTGFPRVSFKEGAVLTSMFLYPPVLHLK